jgi:hypothetical protein
VALHQTGIFNVLTIFNTPDQESVMASYESSASGVSGYKPDVNAASHRSAGPTPQSLLALAAGPEVWLGNIQFKILALQLEAYNSKNHSHRFKIRMLNNDNFGYNYWDRSSYDCEFVALAVDLGVKLVTFDMKLCNEFSDIAIHPKDFAGSIETGI